MVLGTRSAAGALGPAAGVNAMSIGVNLSLPIRILIAILLLGGCTSTTGSPENRVALQAQANRRVVLLPMNVVNSVPRDLADSTDFAARVLSRQLKLHRQAVKTLGERQARRRWTDAAFALKDGGSKPDFDSTAARLAQELSKTLDYDVLIIPSLILRSAQGGIGRRAKWDGATRALKIERRLRNGQELPVTASTSIKACSLNLTIVASTGEVIHRKRHGLDLIEYVEVKRHRDFDANTYSWSLEKKTPALEDLDRTADGVAGALFPFLPRDPPD